MLRVNWNALHLPSQRAARGHGDASNTLDVILNLGLVYIKKKKVTDWKNEERVTLSYEPIPFFGSIGLFKLF